MIQTATTVQTQNCTNVRKHNGNICTKFILCKIYLKSIVSTHIFNTFIVWESGDKHNAESNVNKS